jgi:D-alanyl-D-alanine endopeptidase (penicillin-binding protein 7)
MKKILFVLTLTLSLNVFAQPKSVHVVDLDNNHVVYSVNDEQIVPIASITKLMTALIVVEENLPLDEVIEITNDDVIGTYLKNKPTYSRMNVGMKFTREELLQLALVSSQNRAAYALARTSFGGVPYFVDKMNEKARQLNMENTFFVEPTGLNDKNVSTAKDLVILLSYIKEKYPIIGEISVKPSLHFTNTQFNTTNRFVHSDKWNITLQKTGFINQAGKCVAMLANIANKQIAIIILGATNSSERFTIANNIKHYIEIGRFPQFKKPKRHRS